MSGQAIGLALSVFLACTVEAVEALTIVLAIGSTRSWSSAVAGVSAATLVLAAIVGVLGPALTSLPINVLRVLVGGLLLSFGLQWLRKAILRSAGAKAKHDELQIYRQEVEAAREAKSESTSFDGYAFAVCFKGVLLEGLEVAFIVLTFGANQHRVPLAAVAAAIALLLVIAAGIAVRAPLAKVPENTMKFAVGVLLSSFGMFWGAEGAGASWPGGDAALLAIVPGISLVAIALTRSLKLASRPAFSESSSSTVRPHRIDLPAPIERPLLGVWEFVVGDDWRTAVGVVLALSLTAFLAQSVRSAWWVMTVAVIALLALSARRA